MPETGPTPGAEIKDATIIQLCAIPTLLTCDDHVVVCLALIEATYEDGYTARKIRPITGPYITSSDVIEPDTLSLRAEDDIFYKATGGDIDKPVIGLLGKNHVVA